MKTNFLGPAYSMRSPELAGEICLNLYLESVEDRLGGGAEPGALLGTPGLDLLATIGSGPIRAVHYVNPYLYLVSGNTLYQVTTAFAAKSLGTIGTNSGDVNIIDNGTGGGGQVTTQVALFDGAQGYVWTAGGSLSTIALPFTNPGSAVFQDGFALVNQVGSYIVWQSNINDFTTWQPLNFTTADGSPSNVVALGQLHRQIIVLKEREAEIWINAGVPGFVFQRLDGVYIQRGCAASNSVARIEGTLIWLSQNESGQGVLVGLRGYEPIRLSTYAMEYQWGTYTTIADAFAYTYQQEGHDFYVLTFPTANATWVLDMTETSKLGYPIWHQRGYFNNGVIGRHRGYCATLFAGKIVVGDYANGNLYAFDLNTYTDNGQAISRIRRFRGQPSNSSAAQLFKSIEFDMQTGFGVPAANPNPQVMLRWSNDSFTWSPQVFKSAGGIGGTTQRVKFNRLGMARRGFGNDRVFELSTTDQWAIVWMGAEINEGETMRVTRFDGQSDRHVR